MTATDPAVTAGEQALDDPGLAVVVAEADGAAITAIAADHVPQFPQPLVSGLAPELRGPLEGGVRLGTNPPIDTVHRMSLRPLTSRPGDHGLGQVGDLRARPRRSRWADRT
jgi:hypothetical protein